MHVSAQQQQHSWLLIGYFWLMQVIKMIVVLQLHAGFLHLHVSAQTSVSELYKEYVIFGVEEEYTAERFPLAEVKGACTSKTVFNIFPFTSIKQSGTLWNAYK